MLLMLALFSIVTMGSAHAAGPLADGGGSDADSWSEAPALMVGAPDLQEPAESGDDAPLGGEGQDESPIEAQDADWAEEEALTEQRVFAFSRNDESITIRPQLGVVVQAGVLRGLERPPRA